MKSIKCDEKIFDLVLWLNSFQGITTQFSCEDRQGKAYVLFFCDVIDSLSVIAVALNMYQAKTKRIIKFFVNYFTSANFLRFEIELDKEWLEDFTEFVQDFKVLGWQKTGCILNEKEE